MQDYILSNNIYEQMNEEYSKILLDTNIEDIFKQLQFSKNSLLNLNKSNLSNDVVNSLNNTVSIIDNITDSLSIAFKPNSNSSNTDYTSNIFEIIKSLLEIIQNINNIFTRKNRITQVILSNATKSLTNSLIEITNALTKSKITIYKYI